MSDRAKLTALRRLVARVGRRQRVADAVWQLRRVAFPSGMLILAATLAASRWFGVTPAWSLLAVTPVALVIAWASLRPRHWRSDARRLDAYFHLDDRVGNALEFAEQTSPANLAEAAWIEAAIDDAWHSTLSLDARPVVSLALPKTGWLELVAAFAVIAAFVVPVAGPDSVPDPVVTPPPTATLPSETNSPTSLPFAESLRRDLRALSSGQEAPAQVATTVLEVLAKLERGELDRLAALEQLDELDRLLRQAEDAFEASVDEDPAMLAEAMRELAEELSQHETTERVGEALARQDGEDLEERLDEAFANGDADPEAAKEMERALAAAERSLAAAQKRAGQTRADLEQAERRLRREQKQQPQQEDDQARERRLRRQQERVDELRRQHEREQAAARELERLRRLARKARQDGNSGQSERQRQQRRQTRQDLGKGMGDAARRARKARRLSNTRDTLEEAKSLIRRAGKQNDKNKRRDEQRESFGRAAKGKKAKPGEPSMLIEGDVGDPNDADPSMMLEGDDPGNQPGDGSGDAPGEQGLEDGEPSEAPGDGIGEGSDDRLGDPTTRDVKARDHQANPTPGRGATRAEVIANASQEGFATESYRRVYTDYRSFAQSAMDDETLPAAKRRQVRRYFQMIQPRDENR